MMKKKSNRKRKIGKRLAAFVLALAMVIPSGAPANVYAKTDSSKVGQVNLYAVDRSREDWLECYFEPVKKADGYQIYRSTEEDGDFEKIATIHPTKRWTYLDKGLKKNTYYYYKVRAYRKINGKNVFGEFSEVFCGQKWKESILYELFPDGVPRTEKEMQQYLTEVKVTLVDADGNKSTKYLTVHKKLAKKIKKIFKELKEAGIPVRRSDTGTYNWRKMTTSDEQSHHSYGCVVDFNWNSNPFVYYGGDAYDAGYRPGKDVYSITEETVAIFAKYGFKWGGDWKTYKDYMHFTYTGH